MSIQERLREFNDHIWDHSKDPFQISFDQCVPISKDDLAAIKELATYVKGNVSDRNASDLLFRIIQRRGESLLNCLIRIAGLTRNKILTDIRAAIRSKGSKISVPSSYTRIVDKRVWPIAGPYLVSRLIKVIGPIGHFRNAEFKAALQAINEATWQGYIRQERAKRSGHEAESRLARVLKACGLPFVPVEKAESPMSGDVQIAGVSFDLVIPSLSSPLVCVKSTVHTANIGQYGESKDRLEVEEARNMLNKKYSPSDRPILLAFIDGVGFESNRAGLEGVLRMADEFCQFRTVWKAVVIVSRRVGKRFKILLPEKEIKHYAGFLKHYGYYSNIMELEKNAGALRTIEAGEGKIILP